jgi:phosphate transport system substrate-binding protein
VVRLGKKDSPEEFSPQTLLLTSSQTIVEEVAANEAAIGYLGMGYVSERTKPLLLALVTAERAVAGKGSEFYPPDVNNVIKKTYPLSRPLYFYTNGEPQGVTKLFIDFTLSPKGQQQFIETGFVPIETERRGKRDDGRGGMDEGREKRDERTLNAQKD